MSELPESTHYRLKASFYSVYLVVCWLHLLQLKPIHHCSFLTKGGSFLPVCWVKLRQCKWLFKGLLYVFDWDSPSLIKKRKTFEDKQIRLTFFCWDHTDPMTDARQQDQTFVHHQLHGVDSMNRFGIKKPRWRWKRGKLVAVVHLWWKASPHLK